MRKTQFLLWLSLMLTMLACKKDKLQLEAKDHFYLKNKEAVMPVFVYGNTQSKVFVVYLHGGPGASSLDAFQHSDNPYTKLQKDYAVVYWEQRCAGNAQGKCSGLTLNQYTEDLEKLILLLQHKYGADSKFFLVGHSWGGSLGINYLSKENNQSKISGWVEIGGGHNVPSIVKKEREMLVAIGSRQISYGLNQTAWQAKIDLANSLNLALIDDLYEMNRIAVEAEGLMKSADSVNAKIHHNWVHDYFFSTTDNAVENENLRRSFEGMKHTLANLNLSDSLGNITLPVLMLWGQYDFRVPPSFAEEELAKYGSLTKELKVMGRSAHFVHFNEPNAVYEVLNNFIAKHK